MLVYPSHPSIHPSLRTQPSPQHGPQSNTPPVHPYPTPSHPPQTTPHAPPLQPYHIPNPTPSTLIPSPHDASRTSSNMGTATWRSLARAGRCVRSQARANRAPCNLICLFGWLICLVVWLVGCFFDWLVDLFGWLFHWLVDLFDLFNLLACVYTIEIEILSETHLPWSFTVDPCVRAYACVRNPKHPNIPPFPTTPHPTQTPKPNPNPHPSNPLQPPHSNPPPQPLIAPPWPWRGGRCR